MKQTEHVQLSCNWHLVFGAGGLDVNLTMISGYERSEGGSDWLIL
jgi:hypothetical protein